MKIADFWTSAVAMQGDGDGFFVAPGGKKSGRDTSRPDWAQLVEAATITFPYKSMT
jgi:hypothetical protein